jgi:hypothetical protein
MKDTDDRGGRPGERPAKVARQDRLKLALRENLKRRKSQARGRGDLATAPPELAGVALDDSAADDRTGSGVESLRRSEGSFDP